jgi:hypothetical protein
MNNFHHDFSYNEQPQAPLMSTPILTQIVEQVNNLPAPLQQEVLAFVLNLNQ